MVDVDVDIDELGVKEAVTSGCEYSSQKPYRQHPCRPSDYRYSSETPRSPLIYCTADKGTILAEEAAHSREDGEVRVVAYLLANRMSSFEEGP